MSACQTSSAPGATEVGFPHPASAAPASSPGSQAMSGLGNGAQMGQGLLLPSGLPRAPCSPSQQGPHVCWGVCQGPRTSLQTQALQSREWGPGVPARMTERAPAQSKNRPVCGHHQRFSSPAAGCVYGGRDTRLPPYHPPATRLRPRPRLRPQPRLPPRHPPATPTPPSTPTPAAQELC